MMRDKQVLMTVVVQSSDQGRVSFLKLCCVINTNQLQENGCDFLKENDSDWMWPMLSVSLTCLRRHTDIYKEASNAVCSCGCCLDGGGGCIPPSTIICISHLLLLLLLLWGQHLGALQNKSRLIFLSDANWGEGDNNDFPFFCFSFFVLLASPAGLFSSVSLTNKYLIDDAVLPTASNTQGYWLSLAGSKFSSKKV